MFYSLASIRMGKKHQNKSLKDFTVLSGAGSGITSNVHRYRKLVFIHTQQNIY